MQTVIDPGARRRRRTAGRRRGHRRFHQHRRGRKNRRRDGDEAQVSVGPGVVLGRACHVGAGVSLSHAVIGDRVHFKPGARIGQSGFGWALNHSGADDGLHQRIPQLGRVLIGDDVEIGANATVDRGSGPDTTIGAGTVLETTPHRPQRADRSALCHGGFSGVAGSGILEDDVIVARYRTRPPAGRCKDHRYGRIKKKIIPGGPQALWVPQEHRQYLREQATLRRLTQQQDFDAALVTPGENTTAAPAPAGDTKDG